MTLDLALLGLTAAFAAFGYQSGAVRQLSHWIGLIAAYLFSKPAAQMVGPEMPFLSAVLFPLIFLAAGIAARLILNLLEPGQERGPLDQGLGVVVGAGKGAAILFALLCVALSAENHLARMHFDLQAKTADSAAMAFARDHNIFAQRQVPGLDALKKLSEIDSDAKARRALLKDRDFKSLLGDRDVLAALRDPNLQEALRTGDSSELLKHPALKKILEDPGILKKLQQL